MSSIKPSEITANRYTNILIINWNDGHESHYPFALLRHACPCAECRGGHENMHSTPDPQVFTMPLEESSATRLCDIEAVGTYAITLRWEDGHYYGIYNWSYLRALCPCPNCRRDSDIRL